MHFQFHLKLDSVWSAKQNDCKVVELRQAQFIILWIENETNSIGILFYSCIWLEISLSAEHNRIDVIQHDFLDASLHAHIQSNAHDFYNEKSNAKITGF